jgi:N,N'-diacetyllegionaminate synthase
VPLSLGDRLVGNGAPSLIVAEIGSNHDGDLERALALIDAAAAVGADAVQLHSFRAARLAALRATCATHDRSAADVCAYLARVELRTEWHAVLRERATARKLVFLSTPFDEERAALLAALGVPAFPVAAGHLTNVPLLHALGGFGRPILLGTAAAGRVEIEAALSAIGEGAGAPARRPPVVLVAEPDAPGGDLCAVGHIGGRPDSLVGWADREPGHELAAGAVARGACLVVKPFTDDRSRRGPDHATALDAADFAAMVKAIRELETRLAN